MASLSSGGTRVRKSVLVAILSIFAMAGQAWADKLMLHDGTTMTGRIVRRNDLIITFEVVDSSGKAREKLVQVKDVLRVIEGDGPAVDPKKPAAPVPAPGAKPSSPSAPSGPSTLAPPSRLGTSPAASPASGGPRYYVIPIKKAFGLEVDSKQVQRSLDQAAQLKPNAVVLEIDSPGGEVEHMLAIMTMLVKFQRDHKIPAVAFIDHTAGSAAAMTAMTCQHIFMKTGSNMGSAVIIVQTQQGVRSLDSQGAAGAKFSSHFEGQCRALAEAVGQSPLIVKGMMDASTELSYAMSPAGKPVILEGPPERQPAPYAGQAKSLLAKGKILNLTATEAKTVGVAQGVVDDYDALGIALGLAGWTKLDEGERAYKLHLAGIEKNNKAYEDALKRLEAAGMRTQKTVTNQQGLRDMEATFNTAKASVTTIVRLANENGYIAQRAMRDFPGNQLEQITRVIDQSLANIKAAKGRR